MTSAASVTPSTANAKQIPYMAKTALLLASEAPEKINGRVTYSQQILEEFGWIDEGHGIGFEREGSGYSKI